jgi:hypothetical protein
MILISAAKYLDTITPEFKSDVRLADIGICKGILEITKSNTKKKKRRLSSLFPFTTSHTRNMNKLTMKGPNLLLVLLKAKLTVANNEK